MGTGKGDRLAGIEYSGIAGASQECQNAVVRLLQFGDSITHARILSSNNNHCLLLTINAGDLVAIKSGFTSGYGGEGPRRFSYVLQLLEASDVEIDEYQVDGALLERLDACGLTVSDVQRLDAAKPVRPSRWHDYVFDKDFDAARDGRLWREFPHVIPFAIIDSRIADLALSFWKGPDDRLLKGYRRLEDIVRERTGIPEHGAKLFSQALGGLSPRLEWKDIDETERSGRLNLFTGTYMAHRNPRAHRELKPHPGVQLAEFLLLNHLYCLEREARNVSLPASAV
jgi:hypothetical protein